MAQHPLSILLAEDTPANQKVIHSILRRRGHYVTITENGREALEAVAKSTFDARAAHSLRGLAANFDAACVVELATAIENAGKKKELADAEVLWKQQSEAVGQLSTALEPYSHP